MSETYIKQLEQQNEELKNKLAKAEYELDRLRRSQQPPYSLLVTIDAGMGHMSHTFDLDFVKAYPQALIETIEEMKQTIYRKQRIYSDWTIKPNITPMVISS